MTDGNGEFRVLVAGGGVAGLEAILALREANPPGLEIELLSIDAEFVLTPLSVAEPFGAGSAPRVDLAALCAEQHATFTRAGLAEVWPEQRRVLTDEGSELPYDALLLSIGARRRTVVPSALNFRGGGDSAALEELVASARAEGSGRLVFVVPDQINWPLPLYELALQVAGQLSDTDVDVVFVTYEQAPLQVFGEQASGRLAEIMEEAGIELITSAGGRTPGEGLDARWLISIPSLEVPEIPGMPQLSHGFIPVGPTMRVEGVNRVWAVGDATWSPIKQGGIAAQQADVAAADIALEAGADVEVPPFAPVLRAALLTSEGPFYMRSGTTADGEQRAPLWWPPAKVAGRLLAPYMAHKVDPTIVNQRLLDLETDAERDEEHGEALELALRWADVDAEAGDFRRALHWLEVAEGLNLVVPDAYREKRREWERLVGGTGR